VSKPAEIPPTHAARVDAAVLLLVRGASVETVRAQVDEWTGGGDPSTLVLAEATERLRKAGETALDIERGKAVRRLETLFAACLRNADYARCLAIQREINRVTGLSGEVRLPRVPTDTTALDDEIAALEAGLGVK